MTSYETRSSQNTRNKSSSSEQNDLKKLKSKYSAKLPTLKVLFSDWSDDDLLFVLEEANGDLDLAIDRISEGHANQWGEVKTKKSKKEAQKAKAATTASISPHQQSSTMTSYSPKPSTPSRSSNNDRPNRAGKVSVPPNRARKINTSSNASSSWDKHHDSSAPAAGSWASIASSKQQNENVDDSWNTTNATDNWVSTSTQDNSANNNDTSNEDQPKTWASLLKSKPKPEPETPHVDTEQDTQTTTITDGWSATSTNANDSWNTTGAAANDGWNATSNTTNDAWNTATTTTEHPVVDEWSTPVDTNESTVKDTSKELESSHKEPEVNKEEDNSTLNRLHNQEEPVVLPKSSDIASLDVKFGSLNVDDDQPEILKKETNSTAATANEPAAESKPTTASAVASNTIPSTTSSAAANTATAHDANFAQPSYLKQQETTITTSATSAPLNTAASSAAAATAPAYQQQPQQQQQVPQQQQLPQQLPHQAVPQQQQQQQQPFGMDHLTSAYSSYLPSQPPTGVSGFGMNPMGNLPDYGIYGTEAQRAAAAMGYYDPTAFSHHSPSVTSASPYQARDKYSQDTTGQAGAQSQTLPQQMYPTNLPYYQYYYMHNQYNAYQQSAYGQPFMNKSMYPNMYQHTTTAGKPTTAAAAATVQSPYNSPYGQQSQLYNQAMSGYDDLGLNDYQKSMYVQPQLQGFLGHLNHHQQQQPSAQGAQPTQSTQKADMTSTARTAASNAASQQQQTPASQQQQTQLPQQQQQQQLHQQHPYAGTNNFFGQPQMFSYQQYPQYQQHMTQGHPQQQTQSTVTNRQQQQYWSQ